MAESTNGIGRASLSSFRLASGKTIYYHSLPYLESAGIGRIARLPFSIRVVLESLLRNADGNGVTRRDVEALANWDAKNPSDMDIPFNVHRILMQDFTGVPAVVDLAAMRDYVVSHGGKPDDVQPGVPIDLIIDHSVQVDAFNTANAIEINQEKEMERNKERYLLLKWAHHAFDNMKVFPPSAGICHQVNLEYLATCVATKVVDGKTIAMPDTLVGTDSHTTMINGLGVVGFGVGGIEAEAAALGQPVSFGTPRVLGVHLTGKLREGTTATDFALTLTRRLREHGVVNMFVEFFGEGLGSLSLPDRATLSNMCPEYGATIALFPVDDETLRYMKSTGRGEEQLELVRKYYEAQQMFDIDYDEVEYSETIEVDLGSIVPSVSGPTQPKQQVQLGDITEDFKEAFMLKGGPYADERALTSSDFTRWTEESPVDGTAEQKDKKPRRTVKHAGIEYDDGYKVVLSDGDIVISSITSCTNTSNPYVMIAAGLLAKKALEHGLRVNTRKVKTSMGPGSRVVTRYLERADLIKPLERLGFELVGYGCITCIGNSGKLIEKQSETINANDLVAVSVLSGNRNYEARIHRDIRANYLMSPPLVVAFAIAGTVLKDLTKEPLAKNDKGQEVYLRDIWPSSAEINDVIRRVVSADLFGEEYGSNIYDVNPYWNELGAPTGKMYGWDPKSSYIKSPPFFGGADRSRATAGIKGARVLAVFGDSISTDHISPAGAIGTESPAGKYLIEHGVNSSNFNTYGSRRGNHEVMMRGTFANNRIKNLMLDGIEGGFTVHLPDNEHMSMYDAAIRYGGEGVPLVVLAGVEYGSGSSRDWAAKGPALLGVRAIIAKSFERIHRSNLVGMGIVPLQFKSGEDFKSLGIDPTKTIDIELPLDMKPGRQITVTYHRKDGGTASTTVESRIDSAIELEYYKSGGILNYVVKKLIG